MSFVLQTVAGLLRGSGSPRNYRVENSGAATSNGCGCHHHPNRCCHKADLLAARNSFSTSFECMNDDLNDWHRSNWPINTQWVFRFNEMCVCVCVCDMYVCLSVYLSVCLPVCFFCCFFVSLFYFPYNKLLVHATHRELHCIILLWISLHNFTCYSVLCVRNCFCFTSIQQKKNHVVNVVNVCVCPISATNIDICAIKWGKSIAYEIDGSRNLFQGICNAINMK